MQDKLLKGCYGQQKEETKALGWAGAVYMHIGLNHGRLKVSEATETGGPKVKTVQRSPRGRIL